MGLDRKRALSGPDNSYLRHVGHGDWEQVRSCVYCSCGDRLYQGSVPKDEAGRVAMMSMFDQIVKQIEDEDEGSKA